MLGQVAKLRRRWCHLVRSRRGLASCGGGAALGRRGCRCFKTAAEDWRVGCQHGRGRSALTVSKQAQADLGVSHALVHALQGKLQASLAAGGQRERDVLEPWQLLH